MRFDGAKPLGCGQGLSLPVGEEGILRLVCRRLLLLGMIAGLLGPGSLPAHAAPTAAAVTAATITADGRGNGHGDGLSQWGALGYSVNYGWDWHRTLAHYYGGTTESSIDPATPQTIRLTTHDDLSLFGFSQPSATLQASVGAPEARYSRLTVIERTAGTFEVWGHAAAGGCAADAAALTTPGWTLLGQAPAKVSVTTPEIPANAPASSVASVCRSDASLRAYRGAFEVVDTPSGNRLVNVAPIDQYLRGVVPREAIPSWGDFGGGAGMNALRSQAVAARSYAMAERRYDYARTCDTFNCQVYVGAGSRQDGTFAGFEDARTDRAITDTAGVVLRTSAGGFAFTQFNASSGGITSGANFPAVEDLGDSVAGNVSHRWTSTVAVSRIEDAYPSVGTFLGIDVLSRNGRGEWGGRITSARVRGSAASVTVTGEQLRIALGLRSTWFVVSSGCIAPPTASITFAPGGFHAVTPRRLVDTRDGTGGLRMPGDCTLVVPVRRLAGLPDQATAVSLNLTAVDSTQEGFFTAYPCASGRPFASNLNSRNGPPVANLAVVALDATGDVCIYGQRATDLVIDLLGWYGPGGGGLRALTPTRVEDTRPDRAVRGGNVLEVDLSGLASARTPVALNVTATEATGAGYITVYPCDGPRPLASNLNLVAQRSIANQVTVATGGNNKVCIYSQTTTHVVVDVLGVFDGQATLLPLKPSRLLDTRDRGARVATGEVVRLPTGVTGSVMVNLTSTEPAGQGFVTAYDCAVSRPLASNLNVAPGLTVANAAIVQVSSGELCLYSSQSTHLIVDLLGRYS